MGSQIKDIPNRFLVLFELARGFLGRRDIANHRDYAVFAVKLDSHRRQYRRRRVAIGQDELDLDVAHDAFGQHDFAKRLLLFDILEDSGRWRTSVLEIFRGEAAQTELMIEIDIAAVRDAADDDNVERRVRTLAQCGVAVAEPRLSALFLGDIPAHRNHA